MSLPSAKPVATSPKAAAQADPQAAAEAKVMQQVVVRAAQFPMRVNHLNVTLLPGRATPVVLDDWIQTQINAGTLVVDQ